MRDGRVKFASIAGRPQLARRLQKYSCEYTRSHDWLAPMKHFVLAGVSELDRAGLLQALSKAGRALDERWAQHTGTGPIDLVIVDLEHFAGRVARVRANSEGTRLAVLANAGADVLDAALVLRRPMTTEALTEMLNCVASGAAAPAVEAAAPVAETADADATSSRASFASPRRERECTDFAALLQRGPLLIERPGLPRLVLDPASDSFHVNAPLSRLEAYFLDPLKGSECRQLPRSRLDELRAGAPARPLMQLHWMGALLRSNGCLASHLDPGGTYRVQRWMSVYGEYRKQYRIATMMLRPLRLHEIARKADASMAEVFDVVNAYDVVGLLEWQPRVSRYAQAANDPAQPAVSKHKLLAAALLAR